MPPPFQLNAGHPALDFVNTLDNRFSDTGPVELLTRYAELLSFVRQSHLIESTRINVLEDRRESRAAAKVLRSARELREALADVFYRGIDGTGIRPMGIKTLERHFLNAQGHQRLILDSAPGQSGMPPRAAWTWGPFETHVELPLWVLARSAVELLTSSAADHVNQCKSATCRWLFLDTSKNHSRRWCDMKICGNRMKARRFHARHAGASPGGTLPVTTGQPSGACLLHE
jgi:predicted RNA-binding Zn ribbon-like protein